MLPIRTVLHPTDFSENSALAFRMACSLAQDYGARLIILHVAEPPLALYAGGELVTPPEVYLKPLRERLHQVLPRDSNILVKHIMTEGGAAAEILRVANDTHTDVIVMGTHGRTGLTRVMLGSVAEQVLRRAPCPVVTVKIPAAQRRFTPASHTDRTDEAAKCVS